MRIALRLDPNSVVGRMFQTQLQRPDSLVTLEASSDRKQRATFTPFGEDGLTFADVLDVLSPLQHIALFGSVYRKLKAHTMDPAMRVAGGALFGDLICSVKRAISILGKCDGPLCRILQSR
jgi:hypothetical protein